MADKVRVGVLGLVHDHVWSMLKQLQKVEGAELVGAADPHEVLLDRFRERTGVEKTYEEYDRLLDGEELDAVLVYGTNRGRGDLVEMAAQRGLHAMSEKPMASDLAVADRMLVAARKAEVQLMINWPIAWHPAILLALDLVRKGDVGRLWQMKWRGGHCGPKEFGCDPHFYEWLYDPVENGGGALVDYLGYGANLARLFIGRPTGVIAIAGRLVKQYIPVDDNAVVALEYHDANAVIETTWTEPIPYRPPHDLILYGTEAVLIAGRSSVTRYSKDEPDGRVIEAAPLEAPRRNGPEFFIHSVRTGERIEGPCSPEVSHDAQEVVEAAKLSILTGQKVTLPMVDHLYAM
jgi:predicted dehydrogenase